YCSITGFMHILPNYLIIGGQKCGTNSLYAYLANHPNVRPALTKEIRFFDKYYQRGINWYKVCFPFKFDQNLHKGSIIAGEATERYLEYPHAPKRVREALPHVKLILLLRNPVDRAYSHYSMRFKAGKEKLSFEDAIDKENERTKDEYKKMENDEN
ncbi:MAG: sulfotransferase, partial [Candidatus Dadabacteria bacterium]|nr:sulfotransferase [Candidatus Dadabacteria bacterium]